MEVQTALRALGLPTDTCIASLTAAVLRRAYLSAALRLHPDKNSDPAAAEAFAAAQEAHVTLLALSASGRAAQHEAASTTRLVDLLLRALRGEDVQAELVAAGYYQPPKVR